MMTGTTLNSTVLDRQFDKNPVMNAVANTQKVAGKTQDFGDVLGKTAQKLEQSDKTGSDKTTAVQQTSQKTDTGQKDTDAAAESVTEDMQDTAAGSIVEETEAPVEEKLPEVEDLSEAETVGKESFAAKISETEEPVDEMTIDEIANALEQIIEQIKQILGITDEELLSGMEELNLKPYDLLNSDNMAQLVTTISGEDSVISLVADEELYTALQDITEMVDTKVNDLLENTGLTDEELDVVLQKLQELDSQKVENPVEDADINLFDNLEEPEAEQQVNAEQLPKEPVIIKEDNTQPTKKYDKLPENQQENPAETLMDSRTRNAERGTKDSGSKDSKNFGQNNASQNFQNNLHEVSDAAAAEGVEKFTSESTENILRQLADMVKIVKNENLTEMELQLHPASLGTVNVSLTTKGGIVTAQFTTQNEAVKAAIEAQASQLQANLEEQGVKIEAIEVSVASHEMERNLDKEGNPQQQSEEQQRAEKIQGSRRRSINLRALEDGEDGNLAEEMQGADDATRIAMEIMAANGNTMDLLA